jgi:hypothetical protein
MAGPTLTQTRIAQGVWEGVLTGAGAEPPAVEALHQERRLEGLALTPLPGQAGAYALRLPLPAEILAEGVQTVLFRAGGEVLAQVTLIVGPTVDEDLRAEIALLRAELDLLKRAFQRHCADTAG